MKSWLVKNGMAVLYDGEKPTETKVPMTLEAVGAGLKKAKEMGQPIVLALWEGLALLFPVGTEPTEEENNCGARYGLWNGTGRFYHCPEGVFLAWDPPKKAPAGTVLQHRQEARRQATAAIKKETQQIVIREQTQAEFAAQADEVPDYPVIEDDTDYGF